MSTTLSVSKGCFVFNKKKLTKRKPGKISAKQEELLCDDPWYLAYKKTWKWVEEEFETLRHETFSSVLNDLVSFVDTTYKENGTKCQISTVPTAALLTGINMPDHGALFSTLCDLLHKQISPHVATLHAHKCKTIRNAIEQMTSQFMNATYDEDIDSDDSEEERPVKVKKSQCNMLSCQLWYRQLYPSYYSTHNEVKARKRKAPELIEEDISEISDNHIKRQKLDDRFLNISLECPTRSPRKHFSNHRENIKDEEECCFNETSIGEIKDIQAIQLSNTSNKMLRFNGNGKFLQRTPTKQNKIVIEEHSPRLHRTPRKILILDETHEDENSQITPPKTMKNNIEQNLIISTDIVCKNNEETPNKRRTQHLKTEEESCKLSKSPRTVHVLDDTHFHVSHFRKTSNKGIRVLNVSEVCDRLQKTPAKETREKAEFKDGKILTQRSPSKKNRAHDIIHEASQRSPRHFSVVTTDTSPTTPCSDKKLREVMTRETRKSSRTPKAVVRLVDIMNKAYDFDQNSPCKGDKDSDAVRRSARSQKPAVNETRKADLNSENCQTTSGKSKRLHEMSEKTLESLQSPKLVIKMVDTMYKVSKLDLKSPCKDNRNAQLTKIESERSQRTPRKVSKLIDELCEGDDSQRSSSTERWVCEIAQKETSAEKLVPRIILKQLDEFNKVKSSPQNSPSKGNRVSQVISQTETRHSPRKRAVPSETHSEMKAVEDKEYIKSTVFASNSVLSKSSQNFGTGSYQWKKLIVIIPEFEKFSSKVLQDFILILRSSVPALPIVLIMGIATSVTAVHRSLPYRMSACLSIKVFQSPPSVQLLNSVLEQILFCPTFPFCLGNKTFSFLMDAFLYYDLSVKGFVQAMKFCMIEHFCGQDWKILCCEPDSLKENIKLTAKDIAILRKLPSFSHYLNKLEDEEEKQKLTNDDKYMHKKVLNLLKQLHKAKEVFHVALKCLNVLVEDLPKQPLGTQVRELYGMAASTAIYRTPEYKECFQLLGFLSRGELVTKMERITNILDKSKKEPVVNEFAETIYDFTKKLSEADICPASPQCSPTKAVVLEGRMNRHTFKEKLLQLSKKDQNISPYEKMREEVLSYLHSKVFPELLKPLAVLPLTEVIMFDNSASVRTHIVGAPRAAIHKSLNDPQFYLECECCVQPEKNSILSSMPDLCIAYKLYRECGRLINLFDWLQAFSAIVNPQDNDAEERELEPHVQARFTRAVAELQFMGFLKTSSRKVDHVTKLFFDGGF